MKGDAKVVTPAIEGYNLARRNEEDAQRFVAAMRDALAKKGAAFGRTTIYYTVRFRGRDRELEPNSELVDMLRRIAGDPVVIEDVCRRLLERARTETQVAADLARTDALRLLNETMNEGA